MHFNRNATMFIITSTILLTIACTIPGLNTRAETPQPSFTSTSAPEVTQPPNPARISDITDGQQPEWFFGDALLAFEKGKHLSQQGLHHKAIQAFKSAQQLHGKPSAVTENRIGMSYQLLAQHEIAIEHFSKALNIEESPTDRVNRATSHLALGQCDLAINDAQSALAQDTQQGQGVHTDAQAHIVLGGCHLQQDDPDTSLPHLQKALSIAKDHEYPHDDLASFHHLTATAHTLLGQLADAADHLTDAIQLHDTPEYRTTRGWIYLAQQQCSLAKTDAQLALTMPAEPEPEYHPHAEAHQIIANCYWENDDLQLAREHAESAIPIMLNAGYPTADIQEWTQARDYLTHQQDTPTQ